MEISEKIETHEEATLIGFISFYLWNKRKYIISLQIWIEKYQQFNYGHIRLDNQSCVLVCDAPNKPTSQQYEVGVEIELQQLAWYHVIISHKVRNNMQSDTKLNHS